MPWMETSPMEERERFLHNQQQALYTMVELCARYGISRKTRYKWLARFAEAGRQGLQELSRAPHTRPLRIGEVVVALLCGARRQHPSWRPAKLLDWLRPRYPDLALPAIRTDNGVPFATTGIHGLYQLNVWWFRLGFNTSGSSRPIPSRTGPTSGCIRS